MTKKTLQYFSSVIPKNYQHDFKRNIFLENYNRIRYGTFFMLGFAVFLLFSDLVLQNVWHKDHLNVFVLCDFIFLSISIIYLFYFNTKKHIVKINKMDKLLVHFLPAFILAWTAFISSYEYAYSHAYPSFIIGMFLICSGLYYRIKIVFLFLLTGMIILLLNLINLHGFSEAIIRRYFTLFPVTIIALFVSHILLKAREKEFLYRKEVTKINKSLAESRNHLEHRVKEKTMELKKKNIEYKEAKEKAEESNQLKTAFLQNISHEIRTPINAIVGFSNLINEEDVDKATRERYGEIISYNSYQLLDIVDNIIRISTLDTGKETLQKKAISINNLLNEIALTFKFTPHKGHVEIILQDLLSDKNDKVYADPTKLTQVITNLLQNAIKYTKKGGIEFGCIFRNHELTFYVKDNGIGIDPKDQEKVFERFWRGKHPDESFYKGTGLGLAISKGYVELMGGGIELNSEPGKGTRVVFTIPYEPVKNATIQQLQAKDMNYNWVDKKIMIVEDEETNFLYFNEILKKTGATVLLAKNGEEAIKMFESQKIDLILMDIKMPVMNGMEATKAIKEQNPSIPIIAQTAYTHQDDKQAAIDAGCDDFLTKPLTKHKVLSAVEKLLSK
jgi:signal transduction histidine kinase/CheY-like chemotaxis protein